MEEEYPLFLNDFEENITNMSVFHDDQYVDRLFFKDGFLLMSLCDQVLSFNIVKNAIKVICDVDDLGSGDAS